MYVSNNKEIPQEKFNLKTENSIVKIRKIISKSLR